MNQHLETLKQSELLKPTIDYVYERRGRFSALATVVVLSPWLMQRPPTAWTEFEKDFRMYDQMSSRKKKSR